MNPTPEISKVPEAMTHVLSPHIEMGSRITQMNNALLGTAMELAPTLIGVGLLVYGFRKLYQQTLGKIL